MDFDAAVAALQSRGPGRMVPDLDRIQRLAEMLGDPQLAYPSIHVTGTNGKTSVTRMVATLLSAFWRVGRHVHLAAPAVGPRAVHRGGAPDR